ncbi:MAG: helix-turn-helix transcriptional regulator [Gammaproteobacteria bacterium]
MPRPAKRAEPPVYNRIAALRADRGLTRQALADAAGVHYQTIGYLERGEYAPSLVLVLKLAVLFDVPVEHIFSLTPLRQPLVTPTVKL